MTQEEAVAAEYRKAAAYLAAHPQTGAVCERSGKFRLCARLDETRETFMKNGPINLLIVGDSVSHGCFGGARPRDYHAVYHNRLRLMIGETHPNWHVNVVNLSVGGECAKTMLPLFSEGLTNYQPTLVILCFGLNDVNGSLEDYVNPLRQMFTACRDAGADCIFLTPNMLNTYYSEYTYNFNEYAHKTAEMQTSGRMDAYIDAAKATAAECGAAVCDAYGVWKELYAAGVDTTLLLVNFINHPTREMHALFASMLYQTIFGEPFSATVPSFADEGMKGGIR